MQTSKFKIGDSIIVTNIRKGDDEDPDFIVCIGKVGKIIGPSEDITDGHRVLFRKKSLNISGPTDFYEDEIIKWSPKAAKAIKVLYGKKAKTKP